MQIRNNYDKGTAGVFNGSVGVVTALSLEDSELRVRLDEDEEVELRVRGTGRADPRLAASIHRSQGSEYPCVVVPLTMSAWMMLQRNLLYTAVTRPNTAWSWSAAGAPWPRRSGPRVPAAATPPSPSGYSRDGWLPSRRPACQPQHIPIKPERHLYRSS